MPGKAKNVFLQLRVRLRSHKTALLPLTLSALSPQCSANALPTASAAGVLLGLRSAEWRNTTVLTAETEGTASFAAAWAAGELVMLDKVSGLATTLGARCVAQGVLDLAKQHKRVRKASGRNEMFSSEMIHAQCSNRQFLDTRRNVACIGPAKVICDKH